LKAFLRPGKIIVIILEIAILYDATNIRKNKTLLLGRKNGEKYQLLES